MEDLIKARRPARAQLTRKIQELETELSRGDPDKHTVSVKLQMLNKQFEKLEVCDNQIAQALHLSEVSDEQQDTELAVAEEYEEKYLCVKVRAESFLKVVDSENISGQSLRSGMETGSRIQMLDSFPQTYRLPTVELKKFNGELKDWLGFWAQFEKIHHDPKLHNTDKFQYLVQSMVPGTRAERLVGSYPQTAANYPLAVEALKDRFGNPVMLTEIYVRELLRLVIKNTGMLSQAVSLSSLYDEIESHLRALETLDVTVEQSSAFLYPLVESCLPVDIARAWQRSALSGYDNESGDITVDQRLKSLMKFVRNEVRGAERLSYVSEGFGNSAKVKFKEKKTSFGQQGPLPTAAGLFAGNHSSNDLKSHCCIFCSKRHDSDKCINAQSMPYNVKKKKIIEKKVCMSCLKGGHVAKACKAFLKCVICQKKHVALMCPDLEINKRNFSHETKVKSIDDVTDVHSNLNCTNEVLLQTLRCVIHNGEKQKEVRVLLDPGSQKSYILDKTARELGFKPEGQVRLRHLLFGGQTDMQLHNIYSLQLEGCNTSTSVCLPVSLLSHRKICGDIPRMPRGPWMSELKQKKIYVSDLGDNGNEIEVLIGANYFASWLTGRKKSLSNGLIALETSLGWTLSGELDQATSVSHENLAVQVVSMLSTEASVTELWNLETIGITDPIANKTCKERDAEVREQFVSTLSRTDDGYYCVSLPWVEHRPTIPDNKEIAEKRLQSMTSKLVKQGKFSAYNNVFQDWLVEGFIEVVNNVDAVSSSVYYLPHRAVFKPESLTTPVRPVFDASCKAGYRSPSLNDLLEKGPNLLELLPTVLLRFRENLIGISADIRKAFQMIEIRETDRDFLRFLWWEGPEMRRVKVYRHKRVVFGVNCSPFLLAAVLEYHLNSCSNDNPVLLNKLLQSLYVDNSATSVNSYEEYDEFRSQAISILSDAKMNLRNWECSQSFTPEGSDATGSQHTKVLGLRWDKVSDTLSCEIPMLQIKEGVSKRAILSYINKVFDPIGFLTPALLPLKLLLQDAWAVKMGWDEYLPEESVDKLKLWSDEVESLRHIRIKRSLTGGLFPDKGMLELHTFCDASQEAYATVVYLRAINVDDSGAPEVSVQLLMAKSRLAPLKRPTIPRMELLACLIGARLNNHIVESLNYKDVRSYLWSDSTTALAWIKGNDEWGTFVGNRVKEICSLTSCHDWRHVPGVYNPADLPSRGCKPKELLLSRWWEGPSWLYLLPDEWPVELAAVDENAILSECKKGKQFREMNTILPEVNLLSAGVNEREWYVLSSSYDKNLRIVCWSLRFIFNSKPENANKLKGNISFEELKQSETVLIKLIQKAEFVEKNSAIHGLRVQKGSDELYRVRTKLTHKDDEGFNFPILLPAKHSLVNLLIRQYHKDNCHAGAQFLLSKLREKFWILRSRKTVTRVIRQCVTCQRFRNKPYASEPASLPLCRTETVNAFQTSGVDLAGPLYLKSGDKAWLVLFTCAVYRCVHLDFVMSLSTEAFINCLERFINLRGRVSTMYSDNGTNFVGAANLFNKLDWQVIEKTANTKQIKWIFNPPSAAWWGGWWERLIRSIKDLLKRMLGNARLNSEQLRTCLSSVENVINERPLTAITEDQNDLVPLTPAMFFRGISNGNFPESNFLSACFQEQYKKRQKLMFELKQRFRNEYLSQLVQRNKEKKVQVPEIGDIVLVGDDDKKRIHWPLAKIIELLPGKDGVVRVVRIKTQTGQLVRPIQKLYPLEVSKPKDVELLQNELRDRPNVGVLTKSYRPESKGSKSVSQSKRSDPLSEIKSSNSGRVIVKPKRFMD